MFIVLRVHVLFGAKSTAGVQVVEGSRESSRDVIVSQT